MDSAHSTYDFIIVGGGPAGCLLASRLAQSFNHFTILLIEAGGKNADPEHQSYAERHWTFVTAPGYDWAYKTIPQEHLLGREIGYSRGKGLGGSTAINFCVFTRGPKADYDFWAKDVEDDTWNWEHSLERFRRLETFGSHKVEYKDFINASASVHGFNGPLDIGLPHVWDEELGKYLHGVSVEHPLNLDHNSGNPLGLAICQVSALDGRRTTASGALFSRQPANLKILTDSAVEKILIDEGGRHAVGVKTTDRQFFAKHEIILSAGAIDSPKLLLLSGIGPKEELSKHSIPVIRDLPGVGKNLRDHLWLEIATTQKSGSPHRTSYINNPTALEEARVQWMKDGSGSLSDYYLPQMIAYLKSKKLNDSEEFHALDEFTKQFLRAETRPDYELISHIPSFSVQAPEKYLATAVAFMNPQSSGEVILHSADPKDPPIVDPKFLSHPFDRRVAVESLRNALDFLDVPYLAEHRERIASGPVDRSEEEILKYVKSAAISMWHMSGTVRMGKPADPNTCVDKNLRVIGIQGLRVADMSVAPLMPSAHTQAVAYLIGQTAADKIVAQYS